MGGLHRLAQIDWWYLQRFTIFCDRPPRDHDPLVAEEVRADCIVVGRSHDGGALGSVARTLINLATRPVVIVP